jgi:hypothetical protein
MAIDNEDLFIEKYSMLLLSAWRDEASMASILADPTTAAQNFGLPVDAGAVVKADRTQPENPYTKAETIRDWTATPGVHVLHLPEQPMVDVSELTEAELESVAGALAVLVLIL